MGPDDYEVRVFGELCLDCGTATLPSSGLQRRCPGCPRRPGGGYVRWSFQTLRLEWRLLRAFCFGVTASQAARTLRCSPATAHRVYAACHAAVLDLARRERHAALLSAGLGDLPLRTFSTRIVAVIRLEGHVHVLLPGGDLGRWTRRLARARVATAAVYERSPGRPRRFARVGTVPAGTPGAAGRPLLGSVDAFWAAVIRQPAEWFAVRPAGLARRLWELEFRFNHRDDDLAAAIWRRVVRRSSLINLTTCE